MSNSAPKPQPSADTRSWSSLLDTVTSATAVKVRLRPSEATTGSDADRRVLVEIAVGAHFRRYERLCGLAGTADPAADYPAVQSADNEST